MRTSRPGTGQPDRIHKSLLSLFAKGGDMSWFELIRDNKKRAGKI